MRVEGLKEREREREGRGRSERAIQGTCPLVSHRVEEGEAQHIH